MGHTDAVVFRLIPVLVVLLAPSVAHAHLSMAWWGATSSTTWTESDILLSSEFTTDAGQTTTPFEEHVERDDAIAV